MFIVYSSLVMSFKEREESLKLRIAIAISGINLFIKASSIAGSPT
jgi:hypothetical protein